MDRILKSLTEEAPRLFLDLMGIAPLDADVVITQLPRETAPSIKITDYAAAVVVDYDARFLFHAEFVLWYTSSTPSDMARYGASLAWQHGYRVVSVLLLLRPDTAPKTIPTEGVFQIGDTRTTHPFRTVRIWELDPAKIFEQNDVRLYPWAILMKSSDEQVRSMAAQLAKTGDEESIGRFLSLGSIRYHREQLESMLGGPRMGLMEAVLNGAYMTKEKEKAMIEGREQGREQGLQEGLETGQAGEARKLLRTALKAKFPGLETITEIDQITPTAAIEGLFEVVLTSSDRAQVEQAIRGGC